MTSTASWRAYGRGQPVTLVVPGLAATEGEARIPASGLPGTRVVVTLPGHGSVPDPPAEYWNYSRVAEDVRAVADEVGAQQAVGVSLGAGALTRIAAEHPNRFTRLALLLPATLARPRDAAPVRALAEAATDSDSTRLAELVSGALPDGVEVGDYVSDRVAALLRLGPALHALAEHTVLTDSSPLAATTAQVLVVGASADPLHAASVAEETAEAIPSARLEVLSTAAPMLTHRHQLRALLSGFLGE